MLNQKTLVMVIPLYVALLTHAPARSPTHIKSAPAAETKIASIHLVCCPHEIVSNFQRRAIPGHKVILWCGGPKPKAARGMKEVDVSYC